MKDSIVVPVGLENLAFISEFLQEKSCSVHITSRKMWELLLAMDEICSQIMQFMTDDSSDEKIKLTWEYKPEFIVIKIETFGFAFNPLEINGNNYNAEKEEESLGGMGLYLVKQMVDEISYSRKDEKNILVVKKLLKSKKNKNNKH